MFCVCRHEPGTGRQVSLLAAAIGVGMNVWGMYFIHRYNGFMLVFSFVFLCASLFLTRVFGGVGFVLANCINMTARIVHR